MFWYILLIIFILPILAIVIPLKIEINYIAKNEENEIKNKNYVIIYIFNFLKIAKFTLDKEEKNKGKDKSKEKDEEINNESNESNAVSVVYKISDMLLKYNKIVKALLNKKDIIRIHDNIYYKRLKFNLGINLSDIMLNVYTMGIVNAAIGMYIGKNIDKINCKNLEYNTYISNNVIDFKIDCIIKIKLINTINIIAKIILKLRKVEDKNGRITSNRKFNDDSYDFSRKYD